MLGKVLANKYRLIQQLAHGGMGSVFLAEHIHLHELRAIKVLSPGHQHKQDFVQRFFREIRITHQASKESEHIVRIYDDFDVLENIGCYYVMEYLEGESLADRMDQDPRNHDESWCTHIALQVCQAMQVVHAQGIVHRDLKPENLLLVQRPGYGDFVKLVDFGIALPKEGEETLRLTRPGMTHGTPLYMSPEQIMGPPSPDVWDSYLDGRSDQYSLACILFEMLTGRPPFLKRRDDPEYILFQHLNSRPPSVLEFRSDVSAMWDDILQQALSKAPQNRFDCMDDMARHLSALNYATRPGDSLLNTDELRSLRDAARRMGLLDTHETTQEEILEQARKTWQEIPPWSEEALSAIEEFSSVTEQASDTADHPAFQPEEPSSTIPEEWLQTSVEMKLDEHHPVRQLLESLPLGEHPSSTPEEPDTVSGREELRKTTPSSPPSTSSEEASVILLTNPRFPNAPDSSSQETLARKTSYLVPRSSEVALSESSEEDED